jgi:hypothetical protein
MKLTGPRINELTNKIHRITGNPCEVSPGSKLIKFTFKGKDGYINLDMANWYEEKGRLQQYFNNL